MNPTKYICMVCKTEKYADYPSWVRKTCLKECTRFLNSQSKKGKLPKNWHPLIGFKKGKLNPMYQKKPHSWRGGRVSDIHGYIKLHQPNHPSADKGGYILEHHLVMEKKIGRLIQQGEIVHHLDHNPANNDAENLYLFSSVSEHIKYHSFLRKLIKGVI